MNTCLQRLVLLAVLISGFGWVLAGQVLAQTYTNIYSFAPIYTVHGTNSDGGHPQAGLISSGSTLYGTAYDGGSSGNGAVFRVNTDGTGFTNLHNFQRMDDSSLTNQDGANPQAGLVLFGSTLFGIASRGGFWGNGSVFSISTEGTAFTCLHHFPAASPTNSDGAHPLAPLVLLGNRLYGTTSGAGNSGSGTVFAINTDGTGFTNLHNFSPTFGRLGYTNSEGANPQAGLLLVGSSLYGTATRGGLYGSGSIFKINSDGTGFTNLHNFSASAPNENQIGTNSDGALPMSGLTSAGDRLYGTAESGGSHGAGAVFSIKIDGTGFTNLHSFKTTADTNNDGGYPLAGLVLSGDTLYGTLSSGGGFYGGALFAIKTDGTAFKNLYNFGSSGSGFDPYAGLIVSDNALYGTTAGGGRWAAGTVFSFSSLETSSPLTITLSGATVILSWPTNSAFGTLQSTTNLSSSAVWFTNSSPPTVVNGRNTVTNSIIDKQQFYRLVP
jgi:uncharacterized repeat protein (TIGR03803 family)